MKMGSRLVSKEPQGTRKITDFAESSNKKFSIFITILAAFITQGWKILLL